MKDWGITLLLPEINTPKPSANESFEEGQSKNSFILESEEKLKNFFQYLTDVMRIEMNQTIVTNEMTSLSPPTSKKLKNVGSTNERVLEVPNGTIECRVQHVLWVGRRKIKRKIINQYKNCRPIDVESQITNILLSTAEKYQERFKMFYKLYLVPIPCANMLLYILKMSVVYSQPIQIGLWMVRVVVMK